MNVFIPVDEKAPPQDGTEFIGMDWDRKRVYGHCRRGNLCWECYEHSSGYWQPINGELTHWMHSPRADLRTESGG